MIQFLRKLRQNTLFSGRFGRYMIYAIGEIVLVVIGILIALQLNTWNEARKLQKEESYFLQKLKLNLEDDMANYVAVIEQQQEILDQLEVLKEILTAPQDHEIEEFEAGYLNLLGFSIFSSNSTAFNNLNSSGRISIIRNDSIVEQLFAYYDDIEQYKRGIDAGLSNYSRNTIGPFILQFDVMDGEAPIPRKPLEAYSQEPAIWNMISFKQTLLDVQIERYHMQIRRLERLLESIDKELE